MDPMQDYIVQVSLRAVVMIWASLVNTLTDTHTQAAFYRLNTISLALSTCKKKLAPLVQLKFYAQ